MTGNDMPAEPTGGLVVDLDTLSGGSDLDRFLHSTQILRGCGTAIIAVTDSRRSDVLQMFPGIRSTVDALVYEHGSVAEVDGCLYPLAKPVDQFVSTWLRRSDVPTVSGQVAVLVPQRSAEAAIAILGGPSTVDVGVRIEACPLGAVIVPASVTPSAAVAFVADRLGLPKDAIREARSVHALREAVDAVRMRDQDGGPADAGPRQVPRPAATPRGR